MADKPKPERIHLASHEHDLVLRTNSQTGGQFLGCERFPDCRYTSEIPTYVKLKRAGAAELPGFEGV